jgi:translation initiation factor 5
MPILTTKPEGKGDGSRTIILNMSDVARALNRPPTYITKLFTLGAQATFDKKNDRYIVSGAHDASSSAWTARRLHREVCAVRIVQKSGNWAPYPQAGRAESSIVRGCKACGARTGIDMQHKLTGFIVKNPLTKIKKGKNKDTGDAASSDRIDRVDPWRSSLAVV